MAPQKRSVEEVCTAVENADMVLMDVEGTTTPIKFITETLFPYVKENVHSYFIKHFDDEDCQTLIKALRDQVTEDVSKDMEGVVKIPDSEDKETVVQAIVDNITWQMSQDRKTTSLKQVQGRVLCEAFTNGQITAPMYEDVAPVLKKLSKHGKKICIFSSGSVQTQKLVFGHSKDGDLKDYINDYYDTTMGSKVEADSYKKISEHAGVSADKVVYLTDTPTEAEAAASAGMKVHLLIRPDTGPQSGSDGFSCVESFNELVKDDEGIKKQAIEGEEVGAGGDATNGSAVQSEETNGKQQQDDDDDEEVDEEDDDEDGDDDEQDGEDQ